ncbi:type 1 glutamine amidotransferase [uncultured Bifidobacterium sp.]|uniref:type 1 glutamine amidotransferase n=1 Tax=uncultured Bifidobacterium sp. TaxID=165187 RepID=UPI0028DB60DD|nr:type 1 glutamine amidotransferase [uncultured Bifidobacterium sp.]
MAGNQNATTATTTTTATTPPQERHRGLALVIGHSRTASLRRLGDWLAQRGLDHRLAFGPDGLPRSLSGYDALIVLGGAPLPDDDERYPWLPATRHLVSEALDESVPQLGICLGGQLLAYVGGGRVEHRILRPEHGMTEISVTSAAAGDALFSSLPDTFPMVENHVDHITALPADAVLLARSDRSPVQGFRLGDRAWGLQFHPEISEENVEHWDEDDRKAVRTDGFDWDEVVRHGREQDHANVDVARAFAWTFADICLQSRANR